MPNKGGLPDLRGPTRPETGKRTDANRYNVDKITKYCFKI